MQTPKKTAPTMSEIFSSPVALKESFNITVEIMKPEFLITFAKLWRWTKEKSKSKTSAKINTVKKSSKKTLFKLPPGALNSLSN